MATTTPNFGWPVPTSTDLVKDGATAIEALGDAIDASMLDFKGGTTGQVLSKTSATDMDFTWTTQDDANAIQNAQLTAKGALITAFSAGSPATLTVGNNGETLVADSSTPTGLAWATASSAASVNLLLNANFAINQRSYVSAANLASGTYGFDRWKSNYTNTTLTFTASTQGQSLTINASGGLQQIIEQGLVPAGTYTLSWTGTATGRVYNSGGTPPSYAASPVTFTADGTANVVVEFTASGSTKTLSKIQFNAGTGTTWALATPTLQTELAACQRYYYRNVSGAAYVNFGIGAATSTTASQMDMQFPVTMRAAPTSVDYSGLRLQNFAAGYAITSLTLGSSGSGFQMGEVTANVASGLTSGNVYWIGSNGSATAYLGFNAEL